MSRLGWTSLRPVQEEGGAALLDCDNAVILAPTAGGKTEAAIFPTLAMLLDQPADTVGARSMEATIDALFALGTGGGVCSPFIS